MSFENIHGLCLNSSSGCRECWLGDYSKAPEDSLWWRPEKHARSNGVGLEGAPVMLIGEFPSDTDSFGVYSFQRPDHIDELSDHRLVRALQEMSISPSLIYGTTALKCQGRRDKTRGTQMPPMFIEACRENHLGVEIEAMQPAIIWVTGWHSADSVRRHFGMDKKKMLRIGEVILIDTPKIWRYRKLLILRSTHPKDRFRDNVIDMARIVEVYLREFLYGRRL